MSLPTPHILNLSKSILSIQDFLYRIVSTLRLQEHHDFNTYIHQEFVSFQYQSGEIVLCVSKNFFLNETETLLLNLNGDSKNPGKLIEQYINKLNDNACFTDSSSKIGVKIILHACPDSIKSQLGSASTLLNAGNTTNILYKVLVKTLPMTRLSISTA